MVHYSHNPMVIVNLFGPEDMHKLTQLPCNSCLYIFVSSPKIVQNLNGNRSIRRLKFKIVLSSGSEDSRSVTVLKELTTMPDSYGEMNANLAIQRI